MHTLFSPTGHLAHLTISDREDMHDARFDLDAVQRMEIRKCYDHAREGLASGGKYIRKQMERYPNDPIFLNYLGKWHDVRGEQEQAIAVLERTYERFPDYLYAIVSMATTRIAQGRTDEVLHFLGNTLRIEERFPDRDEFHINEVEAYEDACIKYLIAIRDLEPALERVQALRSVSDEKEWLDELEAGITMGLVAKRHAEERAQLEAMPKMEFMEQPKSPYADRELVLVHPELRMLFERSMDLTPEEVRAILALPRESLVQDLRAIVQHSIDHFHRYQERLPETTYQENSFVHHVLVLLSELPGADSVEVLLLALAQSQEYMDLYLGDWLTEDVWNTVAVLADGQLERLYEFMCRPRLHAFSKVIVSEGVNQLGQHRPDLLPAVEEWYRGLLAFYTSATTEDEVLDASQLGLMVGDILDLQLVSLLPAIEALYARGIVHDGVCGTIESVRMQFDEGNRGRFKRTMLPIEERYADLAAAEERAFEEDEDEWEDPDDGLDDAPLVTLPIKRATPKVGRNEPCPCGSGKKFKKCCEGKDMNLPMGLPAMH